MTDKEILNRLWDAHSETPFAAFMLQRKLDLRHDELSDMLNLIGDMADSGETQNGYRIKRVASTVYKLIKAKDKNEAVLGQSECDYPSINGKNGKIGREITPRYDPFPAVPAEIKAKTQWVVWREEKRDDKPTKSHTNPQERKHNRTIRRPGRIIRPLATTATDFQASASCFRLMIPTAESTSMIVSMLTGK